MQVLILGIIPPTITPSEISFSAFLDGSFLFTSGEMTFKSYEEKFSDNNSLTWLILFQSHYGKFILENARLKQKYNELSLEKIQHICGSEIVTETNKITL